MIPASVLSKPAPCSGYLTMSNSLPKVMSIREARSGIQVITSLRSLLSAIKMNTSSYQKGYVLRVFLPHMEFLARVLFDRLRGRNWRSSPIMRILIFASVGYTSKRKRWWMLIQWN
jgi:hypothetical protein